MPNILEGHYQRDKEFSSLKEQKRMVAIAKADRYPIGALLFFAIWATFSYWSGGMFLDKILLCGFIVNALFLLRAADQKRQSKEHSNNRLV